MFEGARLKVKWANQHIENLQSRILAFLQTDFCRLVIKKDLETGDSVLQLHAVRPMPEEIALIIGDAFHNLRAPLDYVAYEIVRLAGGSTEYIKFPVRDNRQELKAALQGGEMKVAPVGLIDFIVDVVQPYPGGDGSAIHALHDLNIGDKHLRLTPIVSVMSLSRVTGRAGPVQFTDCTFSVSGSDTLKILGMPTDFTFQGQCVPAYSVLFDQGQPFEGEPVIPTLHQLSQLVAGTIDAIEEAYISIAPP